jgi:hypothetical protein
MTQLEKHEKAIRLLEAIQTVENRILRNSSDIKKWGDGDFLGMSDYFKERIKFNEKMKDKLTNYYLKNFKL